VGRLRGEVAITKMIIDALKPRELSIIELSKTLCSGRGVQSVEITVVEVDAKTETIKVTLRGNSIDYSEVAEIMSRNGAVIRSIDEVTVSRKGGEVLKVEE